VLAPEVRPSLCNSTPVHLPESCFGELIPKRDLRLFCQLMFGP